MKRARAGLGTSVFRTLVAPLVATVVVAVLAQDALAQTESAPEVMAEVQPAEPGTDEQQEPQPQAISEALASSETESQSAEEGTPESVEPSERTAAPLGPSDIVSAAAPLFRPSGSPYSRGLFVGRSELREEVRAGDVRGNVEVGGLPTLRGGLPSLRLPGSNYSPEAAQIKIGRLYGRLNSLSGLLYYTDNVNLNQGSRRERMAAIIALNGVVYAQLTERFQLAVRATLTYFPLEDRLSLFYSGFSAGVPLYLLGVSLGPLLEGQFAYNARIAGWDVLFADDFALRSGSFSDTGRDDFRLFDQSGGREDLIGGSARSRQQRQRDRNELRDNPTRGRRDDYGEVLYFSNVVSAATTRLFPNQVRLSARAFHENIWYNVRRRGLPTIRDAAIITVSSHRESLRFKPYASYEVVHTNLRPGIDQIIRLGVRGPITDQLTFLGEAGYFINPNGTSKGLWHLGLDHVAGPYTTESLDFYRTLTEFNQELATLVTYRLSQTLGARLFADAFVSWGTFQDIQEQSVARREFRSGLRFTYSPGPRTTMNWGVTYARIEVPDFSDADIYTARFQLQYQFSETLSSSLFLQSQERDSNLTGDSYLENSALLQLTKTFE